MKSLNLESMGINCPIFVNDSLCAYYKKLWAKYKKMWLSKYIYGFWISYSLVKVKVSESSPLVTITHDMMLIWRTSLRETNCWKIIQRIEMNLTNSTSQMLCFLYNYHYWSKLNSHRGLWGIFAMSPQRKDSVVALWKSLHSSLCLFFRDSAVLYFFPSYKYAHTYFSTSFRYCDSSPIC